MKTYKTRNGQTVHMLSESLPGNRPFCGYYINKDGQALSLRWLSNGRIHEADFDDPLDLELGAEQILWLNIYKDRVYPKPLNSGWRTRWRITAHESRIKADEDCEPQGRIHCVSIKFRDNLTVGEVLGEMAQGVNVDMPMYQFMNRHIGPAVTVL